HLPDLERGAEVQAAGMAVPLQGREQAGCDLLRRDERAGKDATGAPLHSLSSGAFVTAGAVAGLGYALARRIAASSLRQSTIGRCGATSVLCSWRARSCSE